MQHDSELYYVTKNNYNTLKITVIITHVNHTLNLHRLASNSSPMTNIPQLNLTDNSLIRYFELRHIAAARITKKTFKTS
jgi:hypothetical protein